MQHLRLDLVPRHRLPEREDVDHEERLCPIVHHDMQSQFLDHARVILLAREAAPDRPYPTKENAAHDSAGKLTGARIRGDATAVIDQVARRAARLLASPTVTVEAFNEARAIVEDAQKTLDDCTPLPPDMCDPE
ncbi:hypothetical protein DDK22_37420 [Cupriavidus necator]|uniref:Uncharacterized protein n=1 Tax=Cupriavidus necator TaxID=106590 RepID=A0A367P6H5_CUPNE|nr:hypothetical protein DDK22_37420 [Cupriavidus necator]